jgi:hypothetical protein
MLLFHRQLMQRALAFAGRTTGSPIQTTYFSSVPYALGTQAVKYIAAPRINWPPRSTPTSPDGLSQALMEQLALDQVDFDFGVDVQTDPSSQPVEDPTIVWSQQAGARREWLATLSIPRQAVDTKSRLAENIAFSPWHSLAAHRPLGAINRARKPVYSEMAMLRHGLNDVAASELAREIEASATDRISTSA